jgi:alpha-tubulin suppressor-like RCC1 family protein
VPVAVPGLPPVASVSAGYLFTCALLKTGAVWCWGNNTFGEAGVGANSPTSPPGPINTLGGGDAGVAEGVVALSSGGNHACALTRLGVVWCWGQGIYGQLGNSGGANSATPVVASNTTGMSDVIAVAAGGSHTCALAFNGAMWCWGYNAFGQLGDTSTTQRNAPIQVSTLSSGVVGIGAGLNHSCAITGTGDAGALDAGTGGGLQCWGSGASGQLGNAGTPAMVTAPGAVNGFGSGVLAVAGGLYHTCALMTGNVLWCWGDDSYGEAGDNGQSGDAGVNLQLVPIGVAGLGQGILSFSPGNDTTCAVTSAGVAQCWGYNGNGQLGNGTTGTTVVDTPGNVVEP